MAFIRRYPLIDGFYHVLASGNERSTSLLNVTGGNFGKYAIASHVRLKTGQRVCSASRARLLNIVYIDWIIVV